MVTQESRVSSPVVGGEDDEGVVDDFRPLERGDDAADGVVHLGQGVAEGAALRPVSELPSCTGQKVA